MRMQSCQQPQVPDALIEALETVLARLWEGEFYDYYHGGGAAEPDREEHLASWRRGVATRAGRAREPGFATWRSSRESAWRATHLAVAELARALGVNVQSVCARAGLRRQNYYAGRRQRQRAPVEGEFLAQLVRAERAVPPRIGGRKWQRVLAPEFAQAGLQVGRDRFFRVLRERVLLLVPRRSAHPGKTHSNHYLPVFTHLIKELELTGPHEV